MGQEDKFAGHPAGLQTPAVEWELITPHDSNPLTFYPKCLYIGGTGGAVHVKSKSGVEATFFTVAGQRLEIRPHIVMSTGTAATPIYGIKE
jgi:hypothetical protein